MTLPVEKQTPVIDGALEVFSKNVYRKASVANIAGAAGISKGLVFHYFGSKKALYLYLIGYCGEVLTSEMNRGFEKEATDYFDRIKTATLIKISVIKRHPSILSFLRNMYYETDPEVEPEIRALASSGISSTHNLMLSGADLSKFKDPSAPALLDKMLTWAGEGLILDGAGNDETVEARLDGFIACLDLLRKHFYTCP